MSDPLVPTLLSLTAAVFTGIAAGLVSWLVAIVGADRPDNRLAGGIERQRRDSLRRASRTYRWFEPVIDDLARRLRRALDARPDAPGADDAEEPAAGGFRLPLRDRLDRLGRDGLLVLPVRWTPEEFLVVKLLEGVVVGLAGSVLGWVIGGPDAAAVVGVLTAAATPLVMADQVQREAEAYRAAVRGRLPLAIDLMALMLAAEATLPQCLEEVAGQNRDHPLGTEFALLRSAVTAGVPEAEALREMARRVDDPDLSEFVLILTGSGHNPALKDLLACLTGPMRSRRIQLLDKKSEEVRVNMTWPTFVVMIACLLIVIAVFALPVVLGDR